MSTCAITRGRTGTYEEGVDKRVNKHNELVPIESGKRIKSKPVHATGNRSEFDVIWGNPSDPIEVRHRLQDIAGEPEVDEHCGEAVHEPPHSRDRPSVGCIVGLGVEGAVECDRCQVGGPDSLGRINEEPAG